MVIRLMVRSYSTLGYVAFFITICVHTPYAEPWIFPCLAFYGCDLVFRMFRSRVKDAVLVPVGNQMTLVGIHPLSFVWNVANSAIRSTSTIVIKVGTPVSTFA